MFQSGPGLEAAAVKELFDYLGDCLSVIGSVPSR